jgi:predicted enzyme related to lactoylglutathione lyase
MEAVGRLSSIILPVADMDAAIAFWHATVGLDVKFRDGDRYAALDGGGVTVALAAASEAPRAAAVSFKVDDVALAAGVLRGGGASLESGPQSGPHEVRATLADPDGNVVVIYSSRPA